jgi:serine/threonine-protein kinase
MESQIFNRKRKIIRALNPGHLELRGVSRLPLYRVQLPSHARDLLIGQTVADKYYIMSVLGYGGMSVVYKAKLLTHNTIVALKTLRMQGLSDDLIVKRFQREAELLSCLNHARIVQVLDYGTTHRGQPFFVMDCLTGRSLAKVLRKEHHLDPERARDIFIQVAIAVDHAHRHGVVHRDLKPANIMLLDKKEKKDVIKVVDFGIAKFSEEAQRLTRFGEVWGSPIYMSPEQCKGAPMDARSDIYSFGIVMYETLTGEVPFLGKKYVETMTKQINEPPRRFEELAPNLVIPPKLEEVVMKALNKNPDERQQTMAEVRADLERAMTTGSAKAFRTLKVSKPIAVYVSSPQQVDTMRTSDNYAQSVFYRVFVALVFIAIFCAGYFAYQPFVRFVQQLISKSN